MTDERRKLVRDKKLNTYLNSKVIMIDLRQIYADEILSLLHQHPERTMSGTEIYNGIKERVPLSNPIFRESILNDLIKTGQVELDTTLENLGIPLYRIPTYSTR